MGFYLTIYTCADDLVASTSTSIDYTSAGFTSPPIISASTDDDVNVFASNITSTTATLNFSAKFTGRVTYIIRPSGT
jgi:hypothetical protein